MHPKTRLLTVAFMLLAFVACRKETSFGDDSTSSGSGSGSGTGSGSGSSGGTGSTAALQGTWNFFSMHVQTTTTVQASQGGITSKTVTVSDYTTGDNTGTLTIDASNMVSADIAYTVSTTATATIYTNGVLVGSQSVPFNFSSPASSGTTPYKLIGTDSLYFPGGGFLTVGDAATQTVSGGCKFTINSNVLTMNMPIVSTNTQTYLGTSITTVTKGTATTTLKK